MGQQLRLGIAAVAVHRRQVLGRAVRDAGAAARARGTAGAAGPRRAGRARADRAGRLTGRRAAVRHGGTGSLGCGRCGGRLLARPGRTGRRARGSRRRGRVVRAGGLTVGQPVGGPPVRAVGGTVRGVAVRAVGAVTVGAAVRAVAARPRVVSAVRAAADVWAASLLRLVVVPQRAPEAGPLLGLRAVGARVGIVAGGPRRRPDLAGGCGGRSRTGLPERHAWAGAPCGGHPPRRRDHSLRRCPSPWLSVLESTRTQDV